MTMAPFRRIHFLPVLFTVSLVLLTAISTWAETRYVSDQLIISLREGRQPDDPIVDYLVTDAPLEVLEKTKHHLHVRTIDGKEGWVRSKFVLKKRPKSMIIKEMEAKITELEAQEGGATQDLSGIRQNYEFKIKQMEIKIAELENSITKMEAQEGSADQDISDVRQNYERKIKQAEVKIAELESSIAKMEAPAGDATQDSYASLQIYELKIKNLETVIAQEKQTTAAAQNELKELKDQHKKLLDDFNRLSQQNASLSKLDDDSEALSSEIKSLKNANQGLQAEIDRLQSGLEPSLLSENTKWLLAGGGLLLLGIILGKTTRRKKSHPY